MKNFWKCTVMMCWCVIFTSCHDVSETNTLTLNSDRADFVVKNLTTEESARNPKGKLEVRNGDVLELVYTPIKTYRKYTWTVDFEIWGKKIYTVEKRPYSFLYTVNDMNPGEYLVGCKAVMTDGQGITFTGSDRGIVWFNVTE